MSTSNRIASSHSSPDLVLLGKSPAAASMDDGLLDDDLPRLSPIKWPSIRSKRYFRQHSSPASNPQFLPGSAVIQGLINQASAVSLLESPARFRPKERANSEMWTQSTMSPEMTQNLAEIKARQRRLKLHRQASRIFDDPLITAGYASVPILEQDELPRGGISVETSSVGRIQYGIPPETIKDSMLLGIEVPRIYIVPTERFCSDWGNALGINLAEFEFPAYFNWFVRRKKCCLVVDSVEAEQNIRSVFEETLLGPQKFRDPDNPVGHDPDDFDPDFPVSARPDFYKEFEFFRVSEKTDRYEELTTDMLLDFFHFEKESEINESNHNGSVSSIETMAISVTGESAIGVPPLPPDEDLVDYEETDMFGLIDGEADQIETFHHSLGEVKFAEKDMESIPSLSQPRKSKKSPSRRTSLESLESMFSAASANTRDSDHTGSPQQWLYSQVQWLGQLVTVWPMDATPEQIEARSVPRSEIFKMPGSGTEYVIHDIDKDNTIIGKARLKGDVRVPEKISVEGFCSASVVPQATSLDDEGSTSSLGMSHTEISFSPQRLMPKALFHPPSFGLTVLGNSHGFDKKGSTSGYVLWINGRGIMIDPPPYSSAALEREGIRPQMIFGLIITHCHADHDAGAFQKVLTGSRLTIITTPTIYTSFIRKYSALSGLSPSLLKRSHRFRRGLIGQPLKFQGAVFHFTYTLHTIPCIAFKVDWGGRSMVFTGDHLNNPPLLDALQAKVCR
jgi:Metallo-beta-lactamase superfamily